MRFILLALGIFVALFAFASSARVCKIDTRNCRRTRNVCGRFGQSNLCNRFSTLCDLQSANCQQTAQYKQVAASLCGSIASGSRGLCSSTSTSGNYTSWK
ncbi:uncharacterized protein LOC129238180 [Anastrepha obliqua]|uniref:uncharacterized protein LOC129238180 n=1 Tax=Anastrepha obliqua TaxID=95512 RepID=UPI0024091F16|nr:uncharacterized protein LOC129238180 [Anastrepha obliqua]